LAVIERPSPGALTLLLPERGRLRGEVPGQRLAAVLAQADRQPDGQAGREAQWLRAFDVLPRRLAVAAITRQMDVGDARPGTWLRADPAWVRADMTSARMLACGELGLSADEAQALVAPLRSLFGDEGFPIDAPTPSRWYLRLPEQARLPAFSAPDAVLGDDLHTHMPAGDEGRRWRRLLNEAQVLLHNHPLNAQRLRAGKPPVNSLWFWGGGTLPDHVRCNAAALVSDDATGLALARLAGIATAAAEPAAIRQGEGARIIDLALLRDVAELEPWLATAAETIAARRYAILRLDFADGACFAHLPRHRWRWWRRPWRRLA